MANYIITFYGSEESKTDFNFLKTYVNKRNEIYVSIQDRQGKEIFVCLDISTAIKFAKTLRTCINEAKSYGDE